MPNGRPNVEKNTPKSGPDLLALAMRRARVDVAAGRVPKGPADSDAPTEKGPVRKNRPHSGDRIDQAKL